MPAEKYSVREIFDRAVEISTEAERTAYLDQACADSTHIRQEIEALLNAHFEAGSFLQSPAAGLTRVEQPSACGDIVGSHIGPYKLLQQIGEGGMGVVYMAQQEQPVQRTVAVKIIKPGMDTTQVIARFEAERQALALMDHPHIAKVLDAGTTESARPYFVMELVKGVPITQYADEQRLTPQQRLELFIPVCQAVQHAHQKGVIHRDLKPTNVLVADYDDRPVPKVIDFGVAKAIDQHLTEKTLFTQFGQVVGTIEYMSPEQAKLNQLDIDTRTDIYSLGVLLYELLTGETPFDRQRLRSAALDEMLRIVREEEPPKPSTRLSSSRSLPSIAAQRRLEPKRLTTLVAGDLDWIVMKALEKDRNRRYPTANALAADVERYLRDETVLACPPSALYRFRKLVRRNKTVFAAATAVTAALLTGLTVSTWLFLEEKSAHQTAVSEASKATAVNELLQEMLATANPEHTKGADYTVRQMLDHFSDSLGDQLKEQPEIEASIRATIGNAYRRLGMTDMAQPHLTAALELRENKLGADHVDIAQSLLDYAWNLYEGGDVAGADGYARQALAVFKKHDDQVAKVIETLSVLQLTLNGQRKYREAEEVADEALELGQRQFPNGSRDLANVLHRLADAANDLHQPEKAERLARESVTMHRKFHGGDHLETGWGLYSLAQALRGQQKYDEAERYYREALNIFRKSYEEGHSSVARTLQDLRDILTARGDLAGLKRLDAEAAIRASEEVARTDDVVERHILRGDLQRGIGELDTAIAEYSSAIGLDPKLAKTWALRGSCYMQKNEWAKAAGDYSEAIELRPLERWYWHERGYAYLMLGEHEKSIADHSRVIELGDYDSGVRYRRGQSYQALGKVQQAEADFSRAIELSPDHWGNWMARAQLYAEENQWEKAQADVSHAIETSKTNTPEDNNLLAWVLSTQVDPRLQEPKATVEVAKEAVAGTPRDGNLWNTLGVAQYRNGNWQEAIDSLTKSNQLRSGGNSFDWFFLAMAHWQLGEKDQAGFWYDKALEWMEKNQPRNAELIRFRAEAKELLQVTDERPSTKLQSK